MLARPGMGPFPGSMVGRGESGEANWHACGGADMRVLQTTSSVPTRLRWLDAPALDACFLSFWTWHVCGLRSMPVSYLHLMSPAVVSSNQHCRMPHRQRAQASADGEPAPMRPATRAGSGFVHSLETIALQRYGLCSRPQVRTSEHRRSDRALRDRSQWVN